MKWLFRISAVLLLLIILAVALKPNYARFKEFAQENDRDGEYVIVNRKVNDYLLFAVFEKKIYADYGDMLWKTETYYGYLLNFHLKSIVKHNFHIP